MDPLGLKLFLSVRIHGLEDETSFWDALFSGDILSILVSRSALFQNI